MLYLTKQAIVFVHKKSVKVVELAKVKIILFNEKVSSVVILTQLQSDNTYFHVRERSGELTQLLNLMSHSISSSIDLFNFCGTNDQWNKFLYQYQEGMLQLFKKNKIIRPLEKENKVIYRIQFENFIGD